MERSLRSAVRALLPNWFYWICQESRFRIRRKKFAPYTTSQTFSGVSLDIRIADQTGESWYRLGWTELFELTLLKTGKLAPGAVVFDCGAHHGVIALLLADVVGVEGKVIAVEADDFAAEVARENVALNQPNCVEVQHAAVSDTPGVLTFHQSKGSVSSDGEFSPFESVRAVTIDELAQQYGYPDVLFIDVEGFEVKALAGATECLKRFPDCMVEVHSGAGLETYGHEVAEVLSFFPADRYRLFIAPEEQPFVPFSQDSPILSQRFFLVALSIAS